MNRLDDVLEHAAFLKRRNKLRKKRPSSTHVYIVRCHEFVKIGTATDIADRIITMQIGCPYDLELLASYRVDNAAEEECRLHHLFRKESVRGEWFKIGPEELSKFVLAATNGQKYDRMFFGQCAGLVSNP